MNIYFVTFSLLPLKIYYVLCNRNEKPSMLHILKPDEKVNICLRRNNFLYCRKATIDD